jgi:hypothetical protein
MRYTHVPVATLDRLSGLGLDAKAVYFVLLTGPHRTSAPGLFRSGAASLAETCETTLETFAASVEELEARGLVVADFARRVVFLPHAVEDDPPDSGKNVSSWRSVLDELPRCDVTRRAWRALRAAASTARDRAEKRPRKRGEELSPVRWEKELGPEPGGASDTPSEGANTPTPTPIQTPIQTPNPTPNPTPTQTQSEEEEEDSEKNEKDSPPLAVAWGSGDGAEDPSRVKTESDAPFPPFVVPTSEELLRLAEDDGDRSIRPEDAGEFLTSYRLAGWKHKGKPLRACDLEGAWKLFRARLRHPIVSRRGAGS